MEGQGDKQTGRRPEQRDTQWRHHDPRRGRGRADSLARGETERQADEPNKGTHSEDTTTWGEWGGGRTHWHVEGTKDKQTTRTKGHTVKTRRPEAREGAGGLTGTWRERKTGRRPEAREGVGGLTGTWRDRKTGRGAGAGTHLEWARFVLAQPTGSLQPEVSGRQRRHLRTTKRHVRVWRTGQANERWPARVPSNAFGHSLIHSRTQLPSHPLTHLRTGQAKECSPGRVPSSQYTLTHSHTHSLTALPSHPITHSRTGQAKECCPSLARSLAHQPRGNPPNKWLNHLFIYVFTHPLTPPLTRSLADSLTHSLVRSLPPSLTRSIAYSLTHALARSLPPSLACSLTQTNVRTTPSIHHSGPVDNSDAPLFFSSGNKLSLLERAEPPAVSHMSTHNTMSNMPITEGHKAKGNINDRPRTTQCRTCLSRKDIKRKEILMTVHAQHNVEHAYHGRT